MIRSYVDEDAPQLATIHNRVYAEDVYSADGFRELVARTLDGGGLAWVVDEIALSGYAMVAAVPGLAGVGDLTGCIAPERQRRGLGSRLLRYVLEEMRERNFWQVAHTVTDLDGQAARFLKHYDFFVEHEEWLMVLDDLSRLPAVANDGSTRLQLYSRATAVSLFCRLYEKSFSGLPWDQPFTNAEVTATLADANNIVFLTLDGEAIGFAWVSLDGDGKGLIEPLGIVPAYQHKGFGRILLLGVIRELVRRGAKRVGIGAWRDNGAAIQLYRSVGFRYIKTFTYLAFNLND